jgi:hypothetical protein
MVCLFYFDNLQEIFAIPAENALSTGVAADSTTFISLQH